MWALLGKKQLYRKDFLNKECQYKPSYKTKQLIKYKAFNNNNNNNTNLHK